MTYKQLISAVARRTGLVKADIQLVLDAMLTETKDTLVKGEEVSFNDLGKFKVQFKQERMAFVPFTGEHKLIPARYKLAFTPSKNFKEELKS